MHFCVFKYCAPAFCGAEIKGGSICFIFCVIPAKEGIWPIAWIFPSRSMPAQKRLAWMKMRFVFNTDSELSLKEFGGQWM